MVSVNQRKAQLNALIVSGTAARSLDYAASGTGKTPSKASVAALAGYGLVDKLDATAFGDVQQRVSQFEQQVGGHRSEVTTAEQALVAFINETAKASGLLDFLFPRRVERRQEKIRDLRTTIAETRAKPPVADPELSTWKPVPDGAIRVNAFGAAYRRWIEVTGNVPQPFQALDDKAGLAAACAGVAAAMPKCSPFVWALIASAELSTQEAVDASDGLATAADPSALLMLTALDTGATAADLRAAFVRASESPIARQFGAQAGFLMLNAALKSGKPFEAVEALFEGAMASGLDGAELHARLAYQTAIARFDGLQDPPHRALDALATETKLRDVSLDSLQRDAALARKFCASATAAEMLAIVASRSRRPIADVAILAETLRPTPATGVDAGGAMLVARALGVADIEDLALLATTSSVGDLAREHSDATSLAAGRRSQLSAGNRLMAGTRALASNDGLALLRALPTGEGWGEQESTSKAHIAINRALEKNWATKVNFAPIDLEVIFGTVERVRHATPDQKEALLAVAADALAKSYKFTECKIEFQTDAIAALKKLVESIPSTATARADA